MSEPIQPEARDRERELEELRNGGPTRTPGMMTTTGGNAGPAAVAAAIRRHQKPQGEGKVAPTTTGDAGTGGMSTPAAASTSDASSGAAQEANVTDD